MKISNIKNFDSFFSVVDRCKGEVKVISPEGDCIVLNSKLCRFVLTALAEKENSILDTLELYCENPEDTALFINYMMEECK